MCARSTRAIRAVAIGLATVTGAISVSVSASAAPPHTRAILISTPSPPPLRPIVLPRDHGAHPSFQVEWWYTAGTVAARHGRQFFWFATIWSGRGFLVAKVNVVDLQADRVVLSKEYLAAGAPQSGQRRFDIAGFDLSWRPRGPGRWSVAAPVPGQGRLELTLTPVQHYVLHGHNGIVQEGAGGTSAYYSGPRLAVRGSLELHGRQRRVSGQGWLDHQWGNFATNSASLHWNWFACQFQNGSDLMLYQFIGPTGRPTGVQSGTFVRPHAAPARFGRFTVAPRRPVIRPAGATSSYPLRWRLNVPSAHVSITLKARARHQFIINRYVPSFWEGAAAITSGMAGACIVESTRETAGRL